MNAGRKLTEGNKWGNVPILSFPECIPPLGGQDLVPLDNAAIFHY